MPYVKSDDNKPVSEKKLKDLFYRIQAEDVDLATDIRTSILSQSPRGGRAILYAVLVLFVTALIWASQSEIEEVTRGEGKVIPASQIQVVQSLEGGILSEIHVRVGDRVKKGDLLLRIDETIFSSSFQQNRARYLANLAKAARLKAETEGVPFKVPSEVLEEAPEVGAREEELYLSRQRELKTGMEIRRHQLSQRTQELSELNVKLAELGRTYDIFKKELEITKPLAAEGAVSHMDVLRLERQASQMIGDIEITKEAIPRVRSQIDESRAALEELQINFVNRAKTELNDVLSRLEEDAASAIALKDRLERTSIRSPANGTVNRLFINTVGGVVQPGMNLIEIVPTDGTLLIEARIKPQDIAFLRPNQKAMIKFTAYDYTIYGGLEAKLEHIGADSITDERGNSYYLVQLRTNRDYLGSESDPLPIIPGMVATVDIITGQKTILAYLLKPILRAKHLALRER